MSPLPPPYQGQTALSAPARASADLWRTFAGLCAGFALFLVLSWVVVGFLRGFLTGTVGSADFGVLQLLSIGTMGVAIWIIVRHLHNRPGITLIGPPGAALRDFTQVMAVQLLVLVPVGVTVFLFLPVGLSPMRDVGVWVLTLPFVLGALLFQVTGEELVFRGYLQQQLAARFAAPQIWMGLPSAIFGLAHLSPAAFGDNAVWIALWAGGFGIALADLTARSGTLGAAIAVHLAMNLWSLLIVALPGPMMGLALFTLQIDPSDTAAVRALLPGEFLSLLISWLAARLALRR